MPYKINLSIRKFLISFTAMAIFLLSPLFLNLSVNSNTTLLAQAINKQEFQSCLNSCLKSDLGNTEKQAECENYCEERAKEQYYLPPITKPSVLPGVTFKNDDRRTSKEATEFITDKVLPKIATRLTALVAVLAMFGIVYAGFTYIFALGNSEKNSTAKNIALYSIIGLAIALLSFTIIQIIISLPLNTL